MSYWDHTSESVSYKEITSLCYISSEGKKEKKQIVEELVGFVQNEMADNGQMQG